MKYQAIGVQKIMGTQRRKVAKSYYVRYAS